MASFQPHFSSFQAHDPLFADQALERRIIAFFAQQNVQRANRLRVGASAGRIVLAGIVSSDSQKRLVEMCCRRVAGVRAVSNVIRIVQVRPASERQRPEHRRFRLPRGLKTTSLRAQAVH